MNGARIRVLLQHNNRSASQLARYCQVSPQAALNWIKEGSASKPRESHLDAIAEFFGISRKELEYGSLLCLGSIDIPKKNIGNLNVNMAHRAAELMISREIDSSIRSPEFKAGMLDRIVHKLSGMNTVASFKAGTCQYDAYMAGRSHAENIIANL